MFDLALPFVHLPGEKQDKPLTRINAFLREVRTIDSWPLVNYIYKILKFKRGEKGRMQEG